MKRTSRYSPYVRVRAVRLAFEHCEQFGAQWAAIASIAPKIVCSTQTLWSWVWMGECYTGKRDGITSTEAERIKQLEREGSELKQANEIMCLASAFFVQAELDHRKK